jgi:hypothetical protein
MNNISDAHIGKTYSDEGIFYEESPPYRNSIKVILAQRTEKVK